MTRRFLTKALPLFLLAISNQFSQIRCQPQSCPSDPSMSGFKSVRDLNLFMLTVWNYINQGGEIDPPFFFVLCPNTDFSDDVILPMLNDTWIICGQDGISTNNCTMKNETHVAIIPREYPGVKTESLEQVNFFGLTFSESTDVSIAAYGSASAWAYFHDCHWTRNIGNFGIRLEPFDPEINDGMLVQLEKCSFQDNTYSHSAVFNRQGYTLITESVFKNVENTWGNVVGLSHYKTEIYDTSFISTKNYFTVGAVGGFLSLFDNSLVSNINTLASIYVSEIGGFRSSGTEYLSNSHAISVVLLSSDSFLLLNEDNMGSGNSGVTSCEGIWTQEFNTTCSDIVCPGVCCEFGNILCDLTSEPPMPNPQTPPASDPEPSNMPGAEPDESGSEIIFGNENKSESVENEVEGITIPVEASSAKHNTSKMCVAKVSTFCVIMIMLFSA